jgi:hypothetical protein
MDLFSSLNRTGRKVVGDRRASVDLCAHAMTLRQDAMPNFAVLSKKANPEQDMATSKFTTIWTLKLVAGGTGFSGDRVVVAGAGPDDLFDLRYGPSHGYKVKLGPKTYARSVGQPEPACLVLLA